MFDFVPFITILMIHYITVIDVHIFNININVIQTVTDGEFKHYNIGTTGNLACFNGVRNQV